MIENIHVGQAAYEVVARAEQSPDLMLPFDRLSEEAQKMWVDAGMVAFYAGLEVTPVVIGGARGKPSIAKPTKQAKVSI